MRQNIKARWVAALRSERYEQGFRALQQGDKFCVLGVLCDLAAQDGVLAYTAGGTLPQPVVQWAGIEGWNFTAMRFDVLNDIGWSFDMLADLIESSDL